MRRKRSGRGGGGGGDVSRLNIIEPSSSSSSLQLLPLLLLQFFLFYLPLFAFLGGPSSSFVLDCDSFVLHRRSSITTRSALAFSTTTITTNTNTNTKIPAYSTSLTMQRRNTHNDEEDDEEEEEEVGRKHNISTTTTTTTTATTTTTTTKNSTLPSSPTIRISTSAQQHPHHRHRHRHDHRDNPYDCHSSLLLLETLVEQMQSKQPDDDSTIRILHDHESHIPQPEDGGVVVPPLHVNSIVFTITTTNSSSTTTTIQQNRNNNNNKRIDDDQERSRHNNQPPPTPTPPPPPPITHYILAILDRRDRVHVTRLEQAVIEAAIEVDGDERNDDRIHISLAPTDQLSRICGFESGTVPPLIGLTPPPLLTVMEESLWAAQQEQQQQKQKQKQPPLLLIGGGGRPNQSILLPLQTIFDVATNNHNKIHVASFRNERSDSSQDATTKRSTDITSSTTRGGEFYQKPFFAIAPPDKDLALLQIIKDDGSTNKNPGTTLSSSSLSSSWTSLPTTTTTTTDNVPPPIQIRPEWISVVGRISGVRKMARRLVFCDLAPPSWMIPEAEDGDDDNDDDNDDDIHPWRSPLDGSDMAVQLILGKTLLCQQLGGEEAGELRMRRLKRGQLVLVQGKTNVGNRDSLKNWISKTSLDIVVWNIEPLQTESESNVVLLPSSSSSSWRMPTPTTTSIVTPTKGQTNVNKGGRKHQHVQQGSHEPTTATTTATTQQLPFLKLSDLYPEKTIEGSVHLVDDRTGVQRFHSQLTEWLAEGTTGSSERVGLVGIDCEWKPNFLLSNYGEAQPVLLLQICLHDLQETYLFDLQTLLRPLRPKSTTSMTETEEAFADAMNLLYKTERLVKVGFQVHNDLQRLAASYPHIASLSDMIHSVLEVSKLGMKILQMTKDGGIQTHRTVTSSLIKMTERFLERTLNKEQQISDWSIRPLSVFQMEYAALDAVVTPVLAECLISKVGGRIYCTSTESSSSSRSALSVSLGRRPDDSAFADMLSSWRFIVLDSTTNTDTVSIQRWKAKRLVGDSYLVQQTWTTGHIPPLLPSTPAAGDTDSPFVDLNGIPKIPSHTVPIDPTKIDNILGTWITKSKDRCVMELLLDRASPKPTADRQESSPSESSSHDATDFPTSTAATPTHKLDFQARSGYVELENAVVLFVTLPTKDGKGQHQSRSYPNEWLEEGSILTWFIKEYEWQETTKTKAATRLAEKMTNGKNDVILFVRRGKGTFFCCGRCRVVTLNDRDSTSSSSSSKQKEKGRESDQWNILKLYLLLTDFGLLQEVDSFLTLVNPSRRKRTSQDEEDEQINVII